MDVRLHEFRYARDHLPTRAEPHIGQHYQALFVLDRLRQAHAVRFPFGDVEQPGIGLVHRGVMWDARIYYPVRDLAPGHVVAVAEITNAPLRLIHLDAMSFVDIDETAQVPLMKIVSFQKMKFLQPEFLQADDHAFIELRIGTGAPGVHQRPPLALHAADVGLEDDTVSYRNPRPIQRHEDLPRQVQAFAQFGWFVHLVRHVRAADEYRFRIRFDERVDAEIRLRQACGRGVQKRPRGAGGSGQQKLPSAQIHKPSNTV